VALATELAGGQSLRRQPGGGGDGDLSVAVLIEDASRIRTGNEAQVMATLRNTATNLARLAGHDNIAAAQRATAWHPTAIADALDAA
jgi:hypothetical protein